MENTSSSDDNILETCVIDSSDLESAENETGGSQVCENNGAPYGTTDSLSRIDGGYESEKTDKNDDTFDENSEKCASDNEIGYYRDEDYNCEDRKYIERVRNDSDDADAVEMHSSPETVLNMKDHNRFNAEALKKNIDGSQHQEWLLMESCTRDPKKMENLPNTTSKSRNERKKERDKHEITNEDEQIDENNGRDAASVDKDGEKMKDSAEIAEEEKVIVNSDNNRDEDRDFEGNNETECGEEIADDDYEKSGENNNEHFEAVNDVRSNDSENLDENNPEVAKESGKDVSFSLAQLIAAKNDDSNYDVMKHLNIIDPELQEGSKKMFIDDIVKGEQSKSILGKIEGELRENYEMEKKMEEEKEIRHEDITHKEDVTQPEEFIEDNSGAELDNSVEKEDVTQPEEFIEENSGAELENSVEKEYVTRPEEFIEENSGAELENSVEKEDVTQPEEFIEENSGAELENSVEKEDVTQPEEFIEENSGAELENSAEKEDVTQPEEFIEENSGANADEQKYEDDIVVSSEGSKEEKSTNYEMEDYVKEEEHQNNAGETFEANSGEVTRSTEHECSIAEGVSETKKDDNSSLSEEHLHEETRETFPAADTIGLGRLTEDDEDFDLPDIPDELFDGYENECPDFLVSSNKNADTKNREISDEIVERRDGVGSVLAVDVHERAPANEAVEYQEGLTESRNSELPIDGQQSTEEGHRLTEQNELVDGKIRENIEQKTPSDQIEDNKNLMNLLNHDNQSKDHVFKEESFYDIDVAPKKVIKGHEIIEEMPNDLWSDEDEELETTFEKLHVKGTAEGFMEEEMSNVGKDVSGNVYQPQESKKLSIVDEKNVTESVSTNDPFARVYEHGMERSADTFRSRRENDLFTTIADRNASPEEKALESLVRKQMNIDDKIRHEDSLERLKNADINEEICQSAEKTVKPGNLFIPAVKNKPKSSFVPKVDMSLSPHKKGVKFQFLRNKLLVFTSVKQCRVNAENEKTEKMKYVERFYRIKSNQRVDAMTKSEIREKAANTTAPNNIYALLLDVRSFKGTEARMTHNPDINEIMRLSFKDQLAATMKCIERKDYGMAFLLSRGNKEAERAALDGYLRTSIDPLFHSFFSHTAEIMAPYKCEPYLHDDGRWVEFLSLILDRRNASDADMESLLEIKKSKADQFYVLVFLYLKFGKSFFHKHKDVLLTNYEFVRIMSYLKVKDIEDLKTYYEEYFLVTDKGMPVMTGGWGWKNYVEKGISKIIGIDNAFAENEVQKGTANKNVSEKTKAMNKDKLRGDEELSAKRKMNPQVEDDTNTLKDKEALFEKHIKLAKENMDKTEQKTVPDYASSFADFFVSEPMLVPDTSYDDQSLPKSVIDRDKDDENDVIIAKKEEKGWGFSLLNLFKRKEKRYKVKCGVECDFKYDPQTKRWINTKAQTSKVEKIDAQKDKVVTEKSVPLPCPVNRKTGEKKTGESIASRYVIENDGVTDEEVNANDIFGVCKKK